MSRLKTDVQVAVGHHRNYTQMAPIGEAADIRHVDVTLPGVEWLGRISITVDPNHRSIEIEARGTDPHDSDCWTSVRLTVRDDFSVDLRT